jgi:diacylglycerol kinase (ATP)
MKIHVVSAVLVGLVGGGVRLGLGEKVSLIFCVLLVFFAEILNTALEALVDLHTEDFRHLAKTTKDAAAAAVLVLAFGTVVIFAAICVHSWEEIVGSTARLIRQAAAGLPLAGIVALLLARTTRPRWVDHLVFAAALALLAHLFTFTVSNVFTALTGTLVALAWRVAAHQRR